MVKKERPKTNQWHRITPRVNDLPPEFKRVLVCDIWGNYTMARLRCYGKYKEFVTDTYTLEIQDVVAWQYFEECERGGIY